MPVIAIDQTEAWKTQFKGGISLLRKGQLDDAEQAISKCLEPSLLESTVSGEYKKRQVKGLKALGVLYTAKALEQERRYKRTNVTVTDVLSLAIIILVLVAMVTLVVKQLSKKPKSVIKIQRWIEQQKSTRDDGFRQVSSSMMALLICALVAGVFMVLSIGGLRLLAFMEKKEDVNSGSEKFVNLSIYVYRKAYALEGKEFNGSKVELLRLYQQFNREASYQ